MPKKQTCITYAAVQMEMDKLCFEYTTHRLLIDDHRIFQRLHRQLPETDSSHVTKHDTRRQRAIRNPSLEESILSVTADIPLSSTRAVAHHVSMSHQTICKMLKENRLHFFHFQRVQALNPADYPLFQNFCQWENCCRIAICNRMWFQHDGALAHFCPYVRITRMPRLGSDGLGMVDQSLTGLLSLYYFLGEHVKNLVLCRST
ncbi:hypothetical protein TNCV_913091 [Trichonephila clavipes]|nr:hypothetical protein TNCV_913091 [Trichonephila clavipes]